MDNKKNINVEFTQKDEPVVIVPGELPRVEFDIEDDPFQILFDEGDIILSNFNFKPAA